MEMYKILIPGFGTCERGKLEGRQLPFSASVKIPQEPQGGPGQKSLSEWWKENKLFQGEVVERLASLSLSPTPSSSSTTSSSSTSPGRVELLKEISEEQKFEVTYVDIEEVSKSGRMQCLVRKINTKAKQHHAHVHCSCIAAFRFNYQLSRLQFALGMVRVTIFLALCSLSWLFYFASRWNCCWSSRIRCHQCPWIPSDDDQMIQDSIFVNCIYDDLIITVILCLFTSTIVFVMK